MDDWSDDSIEICMLIMPNPNFGSPLPSQEEADKLQAKLGFSDSYKRFLLIQNGCDFLFDLDEMDSKLNGYTGESTKYEFEDAPTYSTMDILYSHNELEEKLKEFNGPENLLPIGNFDDNYTVYAEILSGENKGKIASYCPDGLEIMADSMDELVKGLCFAMGEEGWEFGYLHKE